MKSSFFAASLLASAALAHQHHQHARHHKRQDEVVWVTDIDFVTEIVDLTTTIWVSSGAQVTVSPTHKTTATSDDAPQFFQSTTSVTPVAPAPTEPSSTAAAPVVESSSSTPAPPPVTSETPAYVPPAPAPTTFVTSTSSTAPAPAPASSSASSSSGGACSEGSPCAGDITFYDTGLGACGITSVDSDKVVALPWQFMGEQSNGNPYCGRTISITCDTTGKSTTAVVVDKCMGCGGFSIDLSPGAFDELDSESVGRTTATWYFTD